MRVRNKLKDDFKTDRQWAKVGRLPNSGAEGERMYSNGYSQFVYTYFLREETHEASKEELKKFWEPERAKNRERRTRKREAEKAAEEQRKKRLQELEKRRQVREQQMLDNIFVSDVSNPSGVVAFDVETTGLDPEKDEILQFSAIDGNGNVLLNTYICPSRIKSWPEAEEIHNISPEFVAEHGMKVNDVLPVLQKIFTEAKHLIAYNIFFDLSFLEKLGIRIDINQVEYSDIMIEFAPVFGEWSDYYQDYKYQTLDTCGCYYGYEYVAHDSLNDVRATLFCYEQMKKNGQI